MFLELHMAGISLISHNNFSLISFREVLGNQLDAKSGVILIKHKNLTKFWKSILMGMPETFRIYAFLLMTSKSTSIYIFNIYIYM